jgi:hypothetical protein
MERNEKERDIGEIFVWKMKKMSNRVDKVN